MSHVDETVAVRRKPGLLETQIDGEIVALDVEIGECYGMNQVASMVWGLLSEQTCVSEMANKISAEFDVSDEDCLVAVLDLVRRLDQDGLIVFVS